MSKKNIEDRFSEDIDSYLNRQSTEKKAYTENQSADEEYEEYLELGKILADKDFSQESNKDLVFNRVTKSSKKYKGGILMKNSHKKKRLATLVASVLTICVISLSLTQTAFGQDLIEKALRTISLGNITALEDVEFEGDTMEIPKKLKGKLFDEDGNVIEQVSKDFEGKLYTAKGEEIHEAKETGEIVTATEYEKEMKATTLVIRDSTELNKYTCFNVILPSYLPEGYEFNRAEFYKDENGNVKDSKYIDVYFKKGNKEIFMQQRFADEETSYEMSMGKNSKEIKINGVRAIASDTSVDWEYNEVIYAVMAGKTKIPRDELVKLAESIK